MQVTQIPPRALRGYEIIVNNEIIRLDKTTFLVPSQTKKNVKYQVKREGDSWWCECPNL